MDISKTVEQANFRLSKSCYECLNNKNRLDKDKSENIKCKRFALSTAYFPHDWVCDEYIGCGNSDETEAAQCPK